MNVARSFVVVVVLGFFFRKSTFHSNLELFLVDFLIIG